MVIFSCLYTGAASFVYNTYKQKIASLNFLNRNFI